MLTAASSAVRRAPGARRIALGLALVLPWGCAQVRPNPDFAAARGLVQESTGAEEVFDPQAPALSPSELGALLADGLTLAEAGRLALVNNRELQASFLEIGVAHAQWVQAGLLSNPVLDLRFPFGGDEGTLEGFLGFELFELWHRPVRQQSARSALDGAVLRVARQAVLHLADVRGAYFAAVAAQDQLRVAEEHEQLVQRSWSAVQELQAAGAVDAFEASLARGPELAAQVARRAARLEADSAKRRLAAALSIEVAAEDLRLCDALPEPEALALDAEALARVAQSRRLDLRALSKAVESAELALELERRRAWGDIAGGPTLERLEDGESSAGGLLELTLPLFDQNQAGVARAEFELERLRRLQQGARIELLQDVRTAVDRAATAAADLASFRDELVPQAETTLSLAQASYLAGRVTLSVVQESQRVLLAARAGHVDARLDAAVTRSELERELGCTLADALATAAP